MCLIVYDNVQLHDIQIPPLRCKHIHQEMELSLRHGLYQQEVLKTVRFAQDTRLVILSPATPKCILYFPQPRVIHVTLELQDAMIGGCENKKVNVTKLLISWGEKVCPQRARRPGGKWVPCEWVWTAGVGTLTSGAVQTYPPPPAKAVNVNNALLGLQIYETDS